MTLRICAWHECDQPVPRKPGEPDNKYMRRECCCQVHASKLGQQRAKQTNAERPAAGGGDQSWRLIGWPEVTGETDWNNAFAAHELDLPDEPLFRMSRPATHVSTVSTAALLMQMRARE